jgi:predicted nucleotidyltransferase component of viral defense system
MAAYGQCAGGRARGKRRHGEAARDKKEEIGMLTRPQVQRFAAESGLRDIMVAEKEIVLSYLLQLLSERGFLEKLVFKGGTCLRKMFLGNQGRFSTDLDFTATELRDHEDVILDMMAAFETPFHGLAFAIPDDSYYESEDGMSWGVNPVYTHDWNSDGASEIELQISRRETPTLPVERREQCAQSYFRYLPFKPSPLDCLALPEILAEKIRACYQRNKARDMYDLGIFATKALNQPLVRRLVVLKLWQASDSFSPEKLTAKFSDANTFDWADLVHLTRHGQAPDPDGIRAACEKGYGFLSALTPDELLLAKDSHQRQRDLWQKLSKEIME